MDLPGGGKIEGTHRAGAFQENRKGFSLPNSVWSLCISPASATVKASREFSQNCHVLKTLYRTRRARLRIVCNTGALSRMFAIGRAGARPGVCEGTVMTKGWFFRT